MGIPIRCRRLTRLLFLLLSVGVVLGFAANVQASPITWSYVGSVFSAFPGSPIPVGTPVTFSVTADPAQNILAGSSFFPPSWGAYYPVDVFATMAGVNYSVSSAFEVNGDPSNNFPHPGETSLREFLEQTDQGFFLIGGGFPMTLAYVFETGNDPNSPALLMPLPTFYLALFVPDTPQASQVIQRVNISGQLVPEPASGTLLAIGFATAALRKKFRKTVRSTLTRAAKG